MNLSRKARRNGRRSPTIDTRRQLFLEPLEGRALMATLTLDGGPPTYVEGAAAVQVAPTSTVGDEGVVGFDGGILTVAIQANAKPEDELLVIAQGDGTGEINIAGADVSYEGTVFATVATGVDSLTFSFDSDASVDAVQALIRKIGFRNTGDNPTGDTRTIRFSLSDDGDTNPAPDADGEVNVTAVNDAPEAVDSSITTDEDTPYTFAVSDFAFTDAEGDALVSITVSNLSLAGGTLQLSGVDVVDGQTILAADIANLVYAPALNQNGSAVASFDFTVNDADLGAIVATMSLNVTAINDLPVATGMTGTINEDNTVSFVVADFPYTDVEGDALVSITITNLNLNGGSLQVNGVDVNDGQTILAADIPNLVYTPLPNQNGAALATFDYTVNDADLGVVAATITINVDAVNDAPEATDNTVTTDEDVPYTFAPSDFTFTDVEGDSLVSIIVGNFNLNGGTLQLNGVDVQVNDEILAAEIPNLVYTPPANQSGAGFASFDFVVNDADIGSVVATLTIDVAAVNDLPEAVDSSITTDEDIPYTFSVGDFDFTDVEGDSLVSITISNFSLNGGTLQLSGVDVVDGQTILAADIANLVYAPVLNQNGLATATFDYTVNDADLGTVAATMTMNVTAVNDAPEATDNTITIDEDTSHTFQVSDFPFTDVEGDGLVSITISNFILNGGTLQLNGVDVIDGQTILAADISDLVYTPALNQNGTAVASFDFTVNDADPGVVTGTQTFDVTAINDVPEATGNTVTTDEDVPYTFQVSDFSFTDVEGDALVSITIGNFSLNGGTLQLNGVDVVDGQTILVADIPNLVYASPADLNGLAFASFDYVVNDADLGTVVATLTIDIAAVNDLPEAVDSSITTDEDIPYTFSVGDFDFTDVEGDALVSITISNFSLNGGTLQLSGVDVVDGQTILAADIANLVYAPALNQNGLATATFDFTVNDADLGTVAATMTMNVTAVNDAPEATDNTITIDEDTSHTFQASDFPFTDVEGDGLVSITISNFILNGGTLQLNGVDVVDGQTILAADISDLVYTPALNQNGAAVASFDFTVNDADPGVVTGTQTFDVTAINDAPEATGNTVTTDEDVPYTFQVSDFTFTDAEGDALVSITISNFSLNGGTLQLSGVDVVDGQTILVTDIPNLVYASPADLNGLAFASFDYVVNDADLGTVVATLTINVTPVSDDPAEATGNTVTTDEDVPYTFQVSDFPFTDSEGDSLVSITISNFSLNGGTLQLSGVDVVDGQTILAADIADLVYTPPADQFGDSFASFDYAVNDPIPGVVTAPLVIDVTSVNDAPEATDNTITIDEDTSHTFEVSDFPFTDVEGNALVSITVSNLNLGNGTLLLNGVDVTNGDTILAAQIPNLVYTPALNEFGPDLASFDFTVNDASNGVVAATLTLDVTGVNDNPTLVLSTETVNFVPGGPAVVIASLTTVSDLDSPNFDTGSLTVTIQTNGELTDILSIRNQGSNEGQIGVSGSDVTFGGIVIGTFAGGTSGNPLVITFNAAATPGAVQALARNITFDSSDLTPSELDRTVQFSLVDGDGGTDIDSKQVLVNSANQPPVLTLSTESVTYTEGEAAAIIAATTTLTDPDSATFDGGNVTVSITTNGTAADRLEILNQGTGVGQVGLSGSNVTFSGTTIGTFSGGTGTTPLVITLNANATPEAVQALLRVITFRVASDTPSTLDRTIAFSATDGGGAEAATSVDTKTIGVEATNDAPNIDLSTEAVNFEVGGSPVVISASGVVTDIDSPNFDTGSLTVSIATNGVATDVLSIRNEGVGAGQIGVSGSDVTFGGVVIGTFAGGTGGTSLVITFNASATPAAVQALSRNILFSNTDADPSTATRTINFVVNDGDGGSDNASKSVTLSGVNAAPVLTLSTEAVTYAENAVAVVISSGATVTDTDSPNFNGGNVTVTITANGTADDRLEILTTGTVTISGSNVLVGGVTVGTFVGGTGTTPLVITLNAEATLARVQTLLQNITFRTVTENPSTAARTIQFSVTDSGDANAQTDTAAKTVNVTAVNDAPVFTPSTETVTYAAGGAAVIVSASGTVVDPDSPDFGGGTLVVAVTTGGNSTDLLSILAQGSGATAITVSGNTISFGGTAVATFAGGTGTTALTITFNTSATVDAVQAVTRAIGYSNTAAQPGIGNRTLSFTLSDGDGGTDAVRTKSIAVTGTSANPVITLSTETVSYTENATAVIIAATSTVTDSDSTDFSGGILTVTITAGSISTDILSVVNQGTGSGQIGVSGNTITFGGTAIGTFTGGTGSTPLVISLNASATTAAVQALVRRIGFSNSSETPGATARTISFGLTDGDGGTSATVTKSVAVVDVNDAPVNTVPGQQTSVNGADVIFNTANGNVVSIADVDAGTGVVRVTLTVTSGTLTLSGTTGLTFTVGDGTGDTTMTFTGTVAAINTALQGLRFTQAAGNTANVTLTITTNDLGLTGTGGEQTDTDTVVIRRTNGTGTSTFIGSAFVDSNSNGTKDGNEIGIRGVTVTLTGLGANAGVTRTTTTNANGVFSFEDLPAGNYRITQSQPATFTDGKTTGPAGSTVSDNSVTVSITAGQTIRNIAFGEKGLAPTQVSIQSFLSSTNHTAIIQNVAQGSSNGQALRLTATPAANRAAAPSSKASLAAARQAIRLAAKQWETSVNASQLAKVKVRVADLEGDQLAVAKNGVVTFDINAAGQGWFIDPTPGRDEEFARIGEELVAVSGAAVNRVDLLTVAAHELGHILGLDDLYTDDDALELMAGYLATGVRKKS